MGSLPSSSSSVLLAMAVAAVLLGSVSCIPKVPPGSNITATYNGKWLDAKSTWYGKPTGAGPKDNGGACGYKNVDKPPFSGMNSCGNGPIFKDGCGCGSCFEIKCESNPACSKKLVIVHVTNLNDEPIATYHFDLTGTTFGAMAVAGKETQLRSAGELDIKFHRVKCKYPLGTKVTFHIEKGSNPNYLVILVKFVAGDDDVVAVDIKEKGSDKWVPLKESWGAIWRINTPKPLKGPFSIQWTTEGSTKGVTKGVTKDVIPEDWKADTMYKSNGESS